MALRASGTSQYAIRTAGGFYNTSAMSFLVWAYLETDKNASGCIWGIRQGGAAYLYLYNPSGDGTTYGWEDGSGGNPQVDMAALSLNTWTCLAISKSGANITAYRRTASSATFSSASNGSFNSGFVPDEEIAVSNGFDTTNGYFPGRIAGMRQWTAALTEAELLNESHSLFPVRWANLHSWRPMADNTVAGSMIDYSGLGRSLTANGSLSVADGPPVAWRQGAKRIFIPSAGGTTFNITPSGVITPAGALIKQANKVLAGGISPTGALAKVLARLINGSITPTGALLKLTSKSFTGSITPAGSLANIKAILRSFSGAITPSGSLIRQDQKPLSGAVTPTGALIKQDQKRLTGTITPTSTLANIKAILRSFVGSITPSGALIQRTGKALSGAITPTGTLIKSAARRLTGSITPSGALSTLKVVLRTFTGSITPSGTIARAVGKALSGSIAPAGSLLKAIGKLFSGITTLAGNVINFVAGAPLPKVNIVATDQAVTRAAMSDSAVTICTFTDEIGG